jgi:inorganic pyrophosphatase
MQPVTIIVETPKGSTQKYDYDKQLQCFKLNKVLPAGMVFPFDFGFIPGTQGEDGDPLDIIIIKSFTGCAMDCYIIGAIEAKQTEKNKRPVRNDRYIGIPVESTLFELVRSIDKLPRKTVQELEHFFINYNKEAGKKFEIRKIADAATAYKMIAKAGK